jgi:SAM-dependent methyltransferase
MYPFGRLIKTDLSVGANLHAISTQDLSCELLQRLQRDQTHTSYLNQYQFLGVMAALRDASERQLDNPEYRISISRLSQNFKLVGHCWRQHDLPLKGAVFLEVGSGSFNPFARMLTHLMAGAQRAWCLDLDPPNNDATTVEALARLAGETVIDPTRLFGEYPIERREIIENLVGFDLAKMRRGDWSGLDRNRIDFLQRSITDTGLPDHSVDVVVSNSVFEHLADINGALSELSRITKPRGYAIHGIDVIDHRWYANPKMHQLEFLTVKSNDTIFAESNRLRLCDFESKFAEHGFKIVDQWPCNPVPVSTIRHRLVDPWFSMTDAQLEMTWSQFLVRKLS